MHRRTSCLPPGHRTPGLGCKNKFAPRNILDRALNCSCMNICPVPVGNGPCCVLQRPSLSSKWSVLFP